MRMLAAPTANDSTIVARVEASVSEEDELVDWLMSLGLYHIHATLQSMGVHTLARACVVTRSDLARAGVASEDAVALLQAQDAAILSLRPSSFAGRQQQQ